VVKIGIAWGPSNHLTTDSLAFYDVVESVAKNKNLKHEIRNSKQFQMTKKQKECRVTSVKGQGTRDKGQGIFPSTPDPSTLAPFGFRYSDFGFVSLAAWRNNT